jgi:hypothetical protein
VAPNVAFNTKTMQQWTDADPRIPFLNNALVLGAGRGTAGNVRPAATFSYLKDATEENFKQLIETLTVIESEVKSPKSYVIHILIGNLLQQLDRNQEAAGHFT